MTSWLSASQRTKASDTDLDRVAQAHVGGGGALGERFLFGDVDGDADEMGRRSGRSLTSSARARSQTHSPLTFCMRKA